MTGGVLIPVNAHFANKRSLMSAIATASFIRLTERLQLARSDESSSLTGLGTAYLMFAQENPGLYSLMFGPAAEVDPTDERLVWAGHEAFAMLAQKSAPDGGDARQDPRPVAAWALVHGLAILAIDRKLPPQAISRPEAILDLLQPGIAAYREQGSGEAPGDFSDEKGGLDGRPTEVSFDDGG